MLKSYVPVFWEEFIMMTGFEIITDMTATEVNAFDAILDDAINASEEFDKVVKKEFLEFNISFEEAKNLSTFFITAFLKAVKKRSMTGISCHLEKFDEELQNIDAVCENNPDLFRSNYNLITALSKFHTTMGELARALGMK